MSGHSKWAKIRHKKGINDAKKGKIFSKYAQQITVAAKEGGGDPDSNFTLRLLIDKAKAESMPAENIKRAVDRGSGKGAEALVVENVTYEGKGPAGISIIVECLTDNKNRTISTVRTEFTNRGGSLGENGSVSWNFQKKGLVTLRPGKYEEAEKFGAEKQLVLEDSEEVMLALMDIEGILDIEKYEVTNSDKDEDNGVYLDVYCGPKSLGLVRDQINDLGYVVKSAEMVWLPKDPIQLDEEQLAKARDFIEGLEDIDDVQSVWSDVDDQI